MKFKLIIFCILLACSNNDPNKSNGSFKRLIGPIPKHSIISKYWWSGSGIDHTYIWQINFSDKKSFNAEVAKYKKLESNNDDLGIDTGLSYDRFPNWWDTTYLEKLTGKRNRSSATQVYYFFDHKRLIIFYQWSG